MNVEYTLCIKIGRGCIFMCRKNHVWGFGVLTFGFGLLVGCWLESEVAQICFGLALMAGGFLLLQKQS